MLIQQSVQMQQQWYIPITNEISYTIGMNFSLSQTERESLIRQHKKERDARVCDRIKAVILKSSGWSNKRIAEALLLHPETVAEHISDWNTKKKLKPENGGSESKLTRQQTLELDQHLQNNTYTRVRDISAYIHETYGVNYTVSGLTKWLHANNFSFKEPKPTPSKADPVLQKEFIAKYQSIKESLPNDEVLLFADPCHPTMATKVAHGWIKKGHDKLIKQTASRTRQNIMGAINLDTQRITALFPDKVNTDTNIEFMRLVKEEYSSANHIHMIIDNAPYHTSKETLRFADENGITLHHLPPYSPNLNSIERLWPIMNEHVRNNVFFESAQLFRDKIKEFFSVTTREIKDTIKSRVTDNFRVQKTVS